MHSQEYFEQLLADFFDGSLDAQNERMLFSELTNNRELQASLRSYMLFQAAGKHVWSRYQPPQSSSDAIFAQLGFASSGAPSATTVGGTASTITSGTVAPPSTASALWKVYSASALSAVMASLLTLLLFNLGQNFGWFFLEGSRGANDVNSAATRSSFSRNSVSGDAPPESLLPRNQNAGFASAHRVTVADTIRERVIIRDIVHRQASTTANSATVPAQAEPDIASHSSITTTTATRAATEFSTMESTATKTLLLNYAPATSSAVAAPSSSELESSELSRKLGIDVETRGVAATSLPRATLASGATSQFRNTILGIRYGFDTHHSVGVEVGQEEYFQQYQAMIEGNLFRVSQNPLVLWAGAFYRYTMLPDNIISPIVQIVAGGTKYGAIGRAMVGVTYKPESRIRFLLGVESSALLYNYQEALYTSQKVGLTYGVSFTF